MSQPSISGFFPAKKGREGDHASIKKRRLTMRTHLAIPHITPTSDPESVPLSAPSKVTQKASKVTQKATRKNKQAQRNRQVNSKSQKSLQDLFDIISEPVDDNTCQSASAPQLSPCGKTMAKISSLPTQSEKLPCSPPRPLSRAAAIVRLAQQAKPAERVSRSRPCEDREEMAAKLQRLSARALPTSHESRPREPVMKEFRCLEIESPKKDQSKVPAYKRFQSLAEPQEAPPTRSHELPLPKSYQLLGEKFRCTDTVVTMLQSRKELPTFCKLKRAVQEMCRRDFEQRNLAQMRTVYPEAFTFRQESNIPGSFSAKHQLTVECSTGPLTPAQLIQRRKHFHQELVSIVRQHHKEFLSQLSPPLSIPDHQVHRWHPDFALDTLPQVLEAQLPQPPIKDGCCGAADVLRACRSRLVPRVQTALASNIPTTSSQESAEPVESPVDPALRGISRDLLDKIRAKEAAKAKAVITRDPLKEKQLEMLARLPEFVRILRCLFVGEKKSALLWREVVSKVSDSIVSKLSPERVEEHLVYLGQLVPHWLSAVTIKKNKYVKLDRKTDLKKLLETIGQTENTLKI